MLNRNMTKPGVLIFCMVLLGAFSTPPAWTATTSATTKSSITPAPVPIRSPQALEHYLRETPPDKSPLDLLPQGARQRFLSSLVFGRGGLGGFAFDDLQVYLTNAQIRQVLSLFGPDVLSYAAGIPGRKHSLSIAERAAPETALERKFDALYIARNKLRNPTPSSMKAVTTSHYDASFSSSQQPAELRKLDDNDLELLYRAANMAASTSGTTHYLDDMRHDLDELRRRKLATDGDVAGFHQQLIAARQFKMANALIASYPSAGLKPLPPVSTSGVLPADEPTVLRFSTDGHTLSHEAVKMNVPLRIVVVAGCHFSVDAAHAISGDPELSKLFSAHAVWLADQNESLAATRDWNHKFPNQPMSVAWQDKQWHMLNSWNIPTFYVFKQGKLVEQWTGWPGNSALQTVREKLKAAGILDQTLPESKRSGV